MFVKPLFISACLALGAFAQSIGIGAPLAGERVTSGKNVTVEVDRPNSLTGSQEVAVVIALHTCVNFDCATFKPEEVLGSILYSGLYSPAYHQEAGHSKPPHQNFTVAVPGTFQKGDARLSVTHLSLVGAGPFALYETRNISIIVD